MGVTLIACLQCLKAGVLLLLALSLQFKPAMIIDSESYLYTLLYVSMRGNSSIIHAASQGGNALPGLISIWGIYLAALGSGLWRLKIWARRSLLFTSGMTILLYAKTILLPGLFDNATLGYSSYSLDLENVRILLFVDVFIFIYLLRGNIADFFQQKAR